MIKPQAKVPREVIVMSLTAGGKPLAWRRVTFDVQTRGGTVSPAITDQNGIATTVFSDVAPMASDAEIMARVDGDTITRKITVKKWEEEKKDTAAIAGVSVQKWWFVDRQLRHWTTAYISGADSATCSNKSVKFKVEGEGLVSPDTAMAEWLGGKCVAQARWKLGKDVGVNVLRYELIGSDAKPRTVIANGRALPRLMTGLYGGFRKVPRSYKRDVQTSSQTITVTKGDTTIQSQLQANSFSIDSAPGAGGGVFVGADFPIALAWPRVRASLGMNLTNPGKEVVAGLAILQLAGFHRESIGWDLHLISIWRRRTEISNLNACLTDKTVTCAKESRTRFEHHGYGLMAAFDGSSLLDKLMSAFPLF